MGTSGRVSVRGRWRRGMVGDRQARHTLHMIAAFEGAQVVRTGIWSTQFYAKIVPCLPSPGITADHPIFIFSGDGIDRHANADQPHQRLVVPGDARFSPIFIDKESPQVNATEATRAYHVDFQHSRIDFGVVRQGGSDIKMQQGKGCVLAITGIIIYFKIIIAAEISVRRKAVNSGIRIGVHIYSGG